MCGKVLKRRWRILTKPIDLKLDTVLLIIYTSLILHNYCHTASALDENEVKAYMERHKLKKANMVGQPDPAYSSNTREGECITRIITEKINHNLDIS